jgi:hypothetical protein
MNRYLAGILLVVLSVWGGTLAQQSLSSAQWEQDCSSAHVEIIGSLVRCYAEEQPTSTPTPEPTSTMTPEPTATPVPTETPVAELFEPFPDAPHCMEPEGSHDTTAFHTLWDSERGCHYDHEHGVDPFTSEVEAAFPGFDLLALLGGVEIGHTNPSSPTENVVKHGGMKWQVQLDVPGDCEAGFEGATYCVEAAVIQYHNFGDYSIEFEARIHSTVALLKVCAPANPADCGYLYTVQLQEYGQRTTPYQGTVLPYPNNFQPEYGSGSGPYFTADCVGGAIVGCRSSRDFIVDRSINANSIWTSKPTGSGARPETSRIFRLLFRVRDNYQVVDSADLVHPFTWLWLCSNDGGLTYEARPGCRYNNSTGFIHEIAGNIPASWDNLAGFDTDPRPGRITADGFTTAFGVLDTACTEPGPDCFPIKLFEMFVGFYGDRLIDDKINQFSPEAQPERDVCFTDAGEHINCDLPGAISAGWIGPRN